MPGGWLVFCSFRVRVLAVLPVGIFGCSQGKIKGDVLLFESSARISHHEIDIAKVEKSPSRRNSFERSTGCTNDFTYDALLRRTGSSSSDGVDHAYNYTDRGWLATDTTNYLSQDYVVNYDYDSRGRLNNITYPSDREVDYGFTNRGELDTVAWDGTQIEDRGYNALGRMTSIDRAHVDETRTYDNANRVTSIANTNLGTATYTYDANSNKLGETWTGPLSSWSFTTQGSGASSYPGGYDEEDRFRRFMQSGQAKDYDLVRSDIGNITDRQLNGTSQARTFNEVHQLKDLAGATQAFDPNGNLTTSHTGMALGWQHGNGRLAQTVVPATSTAGIEGTNDVDNKRLWKKITRSGTVAEHTVYIYAGLNCIAEYAVGSASTAPSQEYVYGQVIDSLLMIAHNNNSEQLTVLRNQQWSIAGLTKVSDGTIAELYGYDIFGKRTILAPDGTTIRSTSNYDSPYGYTSRRHDEESGLMYFRARYYDPDNGEFISQDPMEQVDGASVYLGHFVPNAVDPVGQQIFVHSYATGGVALAEFTARSNFLFAVVDSLQAIIGDCAKLKVRTIELLTIRNVNIKNVAEIIYEDEKEECDNLECWKELKRALDSEKEFRIRYHTNETDAHWRHFENSYWPGVYVNTFPEVPAWEIDPEGGAIGANIPLGILIWHELIGHGLNGHHHEHSLRNTFGATNKSDYYDPAVKCENQARKCIGIRERVWKYIYSKNLKPTPGKRVDYDNSSGEMRPVPSPEEQRQQPSIGNRRRRW